MAHVPPPVSPNHDPAVAHDEQLGQIFTNMRLAMKVSRETIARRLATSLFIVEAFETGTVSSLPHWRETARIVRGYCELLRLDPEPILWRLKGHYHVSGLPLGLLAEDGSQTQARTRTTQGQTVPSQRSRTAATRSQPASARDSGRTSRRRRRRGRLLALSAPVLLAAAIALFAQRAPDTMYRAVAALPEGVASPLKYGVDLVVQAVAPTRNGLRWVEVSDPQLRKSDKLHTSRR